MMTTNTANMDATPVAGDAACGRWWRSESKERKGPRGGRRTAVRAVCMQCGRTSGWRETERAGSRDREVRGLVEWLREKPCASPYVPSASTRCLTQLAAIIEAGESIPLAFAVEYLATGTVADAALAAWRDCEDGFAMAQFITAAGRRAGKLMDGAHMQHDGTLTGWLTVRCGTESATVSLRGGRGAIAMILTRLVEEKTVTAIAALAEPNARAAS
jgi:hypothetical protein